MTAIGLLLKSRKLTNKITHCGAEFYFTKLMKPRLLGMAENTVKSILKRICIIFLPDKPFQLELVSLIDFPPGFQVDDVLGMDFLGKYRFTIEPDTATLVLREIPKKK